jgi:hypothetical protein
MSGESAIQIVLTQIPLDETRARTRVTVNIGNIRAVAPDSLAG